MLVLEVDDEAAGCSFCRDWIVRLVRKESDWRICFCLLEVCNCWRREVRFSLRSVSDIIEESRRDDEEGQSSEARAFVRA